MADPKTSAEAGYEKRDVFLNAPVWLALVIIALIVGAALVCAWLFGWFEVAADRDEVLRIPDGQRAPLEVPDPVQTQREAIEHAAKETLASYGWTDPAQDRVRVPIERALDLASERGLPIFEAVPTEGEGR